MKHLVKHLEIAMFMMGAAALVYAVASAIDTRLAQGRLQREFQDELPVFDRGAPSAAVTAAPVEAGGIVGRLEIRRLGIDVIVLEGTSSELLDHAAGHIEYTAWPGADGNVGVAAHRDTFFRDLGEIRADDVVTLTGPNGDVHEYRVQATRVVGPEDVFVLDDVGYPALTLVTCYPFSYVGPAPDRFIVHARSVAPSESAAEKDQRSSASIA